MRKLSVIIYLLFICTEAKSQYMYESGNGFGGDFLILQDNSAMIHNMLWNNYSNNDELSSQEDIKTITDSLIDQCNDGNMMICGQIGMAYYEGKNIDQNLAKASEFLEKACNGGFQPSCERTRLIRSASLRKKDCDDGVLESCYRLGELYEYEGNNYDKAAVFYEQACNGGVAESCQRLGKAYHRGQYVKRNFAKSATYFRKGCDGDLAVSCHWLGSAYLYGDGVERNFAQAIKSYQSACNGGFSESCEHLTILQ